MAAGVAEVPGETPIRVLHLSALYTLIEIDRDFRRIRVRSRRQRKINGAFEAYAIYPLARLIG